MLRLPLGRPRLDGPDRRARPDDRPSADEQRLTLLVDVDPHVASAPDRDAVLIEFLTVAQDLDQHGLPIGRKRDVRVHIDDESDALLVSRRSLLRPSSAVWTVKSRSAAAAAATSTCCVRRRRPPTSPCSPCASLSAARWRRVSSGSSSSPATKRRCAENASSTAPSTELAAGRYGSFRQSRKSATGSANLIELDEERVVAVRAVELDVAGGDAGRREQLDDLPALVRRVEDVAS